MLELSGICMRYDGISVLQNFNLTLACGQVVALMGPNGAGKSTVANIIAGSLAPSEGRVSLNGRDVTALSVHRRARGGVARTYQQVRIFPGMTVAEHMDAAGSHRRSLWPFHARRESGRAAALAPALGKTALAEKMAWPVERLSTVEKRHLELWCALLRQPRVLVLDEPAAGMAPAQIALLGEEIRRMQSSGIAILLIEHVRALVDSVADVIVTIKGRGITTIDAVARTAEGYGAALRAGGPQEIRANA